MKTLFAILLLSLTGFAFGSEDSDPRAGSDVTYEPLKYPVLEPGTGPLPQSVEGEEGEPSPEIELGQDPGAMGEEEGDEESEEGEEQPE